MIYVASAAGDADADEEEEDDDGSLQPRALPIDDSAPVVGGLQLGLGIVSFSSCLDF